MSEAQVLNRNDVLVSQHLSAISEEHHQSNKSSSKVLHSFKFVDDSDDDLDDDAEESDELEQ